MSIQCLIRTEVSHSEKICEIPLLADLCRSRPAQIGQERMLIVLGVIQLVMRQAF